MNTGFTDDDLSMLESPWYMWPAFAIVYVAIYVLIAIDWAAEKVGMIDFEY